MYHITLKAIPAEIVYGRGISYDKTHTVNWDQIRGHKKLVLKNNEQENFKQIASTYRDGDKILLPRHQSILQWNCQINKR